MEVIELEKGCYVGSKVKEHSYQGIVTSETIFPESCISDWHYHQNPHYAHILSGGSQEIRETGAQIQSEGDGLYYYPGIPHQNIHYQENTRIFNLEIEKTFFVAHQLEIPSVAQMFSNRKQFNAAGLVKILKEHRLNDQHSRFAISQLCVNLIADSTEVVRFQPEWTRKIIDILRETWSENHSLSSLAAMVQIHPVTLSKYFSTYFKCTLGEYLRKIKVDEAMKLMRSGKKSLTEIAYDCGFSDQSHFTKTFLHFTGMLPKQYRRL